MPPQQVRDANRPSCAGSGAFLSSLLHTGATGTASTVAVGTRTAGGWDELTYAELDRRSAMVGGWLRRNGVRAGDRVVLHGESSGDWVAAFLGILRCGGVAMPVDPRLTPPELAAVVERGSPAATVVANGPDAEGAGGAVAVLTFEEVAGLGGEAVCGVDRGMDEPALVVWSSGTTGAPKGVTLTFANLAYAVGGACFEQSLDGDDRWLSVLPLNHMLELSCGLLACLVSGAQVSFARTLMPQEIVTAMAERGTTRMTVVPLVLRLLRPELERRPRPLRALYCGGAPLAPALLESYAAIGVPVYQGYGLTETAPLVSVNTPLHNRAGSVGRPLPGTEIRFGTDREILVRSPAVMAGYWGEPELTRAAVDSEGWFRTGDMGDLDDDGFLYVTGRLKSLIVLESGKKVEPEEVEAALQEGDRFADVCVVGIKPAGDRAPGAEQVCAVVVGHGPLTGEEAAEEVRRLVAPLSGYKRPTMVHVLDRPLSRSAKGSVRRHEVARLVTERLQGR